LEDESLRNERLGKESLEKGSLENERMERERERGDFNGRIKVPCAKGKNGSHRTFDFAVDFGPREEVPHLSSGTARLRATCHRRISRTVPRHRTPGGS